MVQEYPIEKVLAEGELRGGGKVHWQGELRGEGKVH